MVLPDLLTLEGELHLLLDLLAPQNAFFYKRITADSVLCSLSLFTTAKIPQLFLPVYTSRFFLKAKDAS